MDNKDITIIDNKPAPANRTEKGYFVKGVCPNPSGRPKQLKEFTELARTNSVEALQTCVEIMKNKGAKNADRLKAAEILLDRAWGKPVQAIDGGVDENGDSKPISLEHILKVIGGNK